MLMFREVIRRKEELIPRSIEMEYEGLVYTQANTRRNARKGEGHGERGTAANTLLHRA